MNNTTKAFACTSTNPVARESTVKRVLLITLVLVQDGEFTLKYVGIDIFIYYIIQKKFWVYCLDITFSTSQKFVLFHRFLCTL